MCVSKLSLLSLQQINIERRNFTSKQTGTGVLLSSSSWRSHPQDLQSFLSSTSLAECLRSKLQVLQSRTHHLLLQSHLPLRRTRPSDPADAGSLPPPAIWVALIYGC